MSQEQHPSFTDASKAGHILHPTTTPHPHMPLEQSLPGAPGPMSAASHVHAAKELHAHEAGLAGGSAHHQASGSGSATSTHSRQSFRGDIVPGSVPAADVMLDARGTGVVKKL